MVGELALRVEEIKGSGRENIQNRSSLLCIKRSLVSVGWLERLDQEKVG